MFTPEELVRLSSHELEQIKNWFLEYRTYLEVIALARVYGPALNRTTAHFEDYFGPETIFASLCRIRDYANCSVVKNMADELIKQALDFETSRTVDADEASAKNGSADSRGWIYIVAAKDDGELVKIGMTHRTPSERLNEFCPKLPFETRLIHSIKTSNARQLEAWIHKKLAEKRVRGEWFRLSAADVEWLKKMEYVDVEVERGGEVEAAVDTSTMYSGSVYIKEIAQE